MKFTKTHIADGALLGANHIAEMDRWTLENHARRLAHSVYVGDRVALGRILGRYKLYVATTDVGFGAHVLLDGLWESWLTVFMARIIKRGMNVIDVGANHGYYTVLFADLVGPDGLVAAIEPHPRTAELLRRSVDVNGFSGRVTVTEMAASAEDGGSLVFHAPPTEPKNARVVPGGDLSHPEHVKVKAGRIDSIVKRWDRVDFVKIDVEGAEEAALAGLTRVLKRDKPRLLLEFNANRCAAPELLIDRLIKLYGGLRAVGFNCRAEPVSREEVLKPERTEDWILYFEAR